VANKQKKLKLPVVLTDDFIRKTMRVIDQASIGIAFVIDSQKRLCGVVTDGDKYDANPA